MLYLGMDFFMFLVLEINWTSWICRFIGFITYENFQLLNNANKCFHNHPYYRIIYFMTIDINILKIHHQVG